MSYPHPINGSNYDESSAAEAPLKDVVSNDDAAADYTAEAAVNLSSNRLRRPEIVDPDDVDLVEADLDEVDEADDYDPNDPYGVGVNSDDSDRDDEFYSVSGGDDPYGAADTLNDPAKWGMRGRINAAFNMTKPPRPDSDEAEFRRNVARIQQSVPGVPLITVANTMGREGVTSFALGLAYAIGEHRNDAPVAVDFNEGGGTLGSRAHTEGQPLIVDTPYGQVQRQPTIFDLLANGRDLMDSKKSNRGSVDSFLRRQPSGVDVLAGDENGFHGTMVGRDETAAVFEVLRNYRKMVFADTGNNMLASAWEWSIENADQLVVPVTLRKDSIKKVKAMLGRIYRQPHLRELVSRALVIVTLTPESVPGLEDLLEHELERNFGIRELIYFPFDGLLASGERIVWSHLEHGTQCALVSVAADITDRLAVRFQHSQNTGGYGAPSGPAAGTTGAIPTPGPVTDPSTGGFAFSEGPRGNANPASGQFPSAQLYGDPSRGGGTREVVTSGGFQSQAFATQARESREFPAQDPYQADPIGGGAHRAAAAAWV